MKMKLTRLTKRSLAIVLSILMMISVLGIGSLFTANAYYWYGGTFKFYGSINSWSKSSNYITATNNSSKTEQHYVEIYLQGSSSTSDKTYYRFYEDDSGSGNNSDFCPNGGTDTKTTTSGQQSKEGTSGAWYIQRSDLGSSSSNWYKVKIWQEHASWQGTWYEKTQLDAYSATVNTDKTSYTQNETVTLSATSSNAVGSSSYKYEYMAPGSSTYTSLSGTTFTASSTGTYTVRVTATDSGVTAGKNAETARTVTSATKTITVAAAGYDVTISRSPAAGGNVTIGGVSNPSSSQIGSSAVSISASPATGYSFKNWTTTGGVSVANANSASTTVTATSTGTLTANFEQVTHKVTVNTDNGISAVSFSGSGVSSTSGNTAQIIEGQSATINVTYLNGYEYSSHTPASVTKNTDGTQFTISNVTSDQTISITSKEKAKPVCTGVTLSGQSGDVFAGQEYTYTANVTGAESGVTLLYDFYVDGKLVSSNQTTNTYTTSFSTGSHTIYVVVHANGNYSDVKSDTISVNATSTERTATTPVTYYVDFHDNAPTSAKISIGSYSGTLTKVSGTVDNATTVYSATVTTPYTYNAAISGAEYNALSDIEAVVTVDGNNYEITVDKKAIKKTGSEVWLESLGAPTTDTTTVDTETTTATKTTKRIYLKKKDNSSWYGNWVDVYMYYLGPNKETYTNVTWGGTNSVNQMKYIDKMGDYYTYYLDVPSDATYYKPYGKKSGDNTTYEMSEMGNNIEFYEHTTLWLNDDSNNRWSFSDDAPASFTKYYSSVKIQTGNSISIVPNQYTGTLKYAASNGNVTVSSSGNLTAAKAGTANVTITSTGAFGDTTSVTVSVTVQDPSSTTSGGGIAIMSYDSVSSTFDAQNATINGLTTILQGSKSTGNASSILYGRGIVTKSGNTYTVKYASADASTGYGTLTLKAYVNATGSAGYYFEKWLENGENSVNYRSEFAQVTVDGTKYTIVFSKQSEYAVTVIYKYDVYDNSTIKYYDADYAAANDITKEYVVDGFTYIGTNLSNDALLYIIPNAPIITNDYYNYTLVVDPVSVDSVYGYTVTENSANNTATITVNLKKSVRTYSVTVDGEPYYDPTATDGKYTYQAPITIYAAELPGHKAQTNLLWYEAKNENLVIATGNFYQLRVTGDTELLTAVNTDNITNNLKSLITHRSYELKHDDETTSIWKLYQNFYVADFLNNRDYEDEEFIGGGVLYYAVDSETGAPTKAKSVVNSKNGIADTKGLEEVVKRTLDKYAENNYINIDDIIEGDTDATTSVVCRYLPHYTEGADGKDTTVFKFSESLQAFQYIYSAKMTNTEKNADKSVRVYSYFVYFDWDDMEYKVSVSENPADASAYMAQ